VTDRATPNLRRAVYLGIELLAAACAELTPYERVLVAERMDAAADYVRDMAAL
jgi:hypothetical protein